MTEMKRSSLMKSGRSICFWECIATLLLLAIALPGHAYAGDQSNRTSPWMVTYAWSPQFCSENPQYTKEPQCSLAYGFLLNSFDSIKTQTTDGCQAAAEALPVGVQNELLEVFRNRRWMRLLWRTRGGCTNLDPDEFVVRARFFASRYEVPHQYLRPLGKITTTEARIRGRLLESNRQIPEESLVVRCNGEWLSSISYCLEGDFTYTKCGDVPSGNVCGEIVRIRAVDPRLKAPASTIPDP